MSNSEFTPVAAWSCRKCGSTERDKSGNCKACARVRAKTWYEANSARAKASGAAWAKANPEKSRAIKLAWNVAHPGKEKESNARSYASNKDHRREINKAWCKANPEAIINGRLRRKERVSAGGVLSKGLAAKLMKLQKGLCPCCKTSLADGYHMDHIIPLAAGGTNEDGNMQLLAPACNMQKHTAHPVDFMRSRGFLL